VRHKSVDENPEALLLVFETSHEWAQTLKEFASEQKLASACFKAIGALSWVRCGSSTGENRMTTALEDRGFAITTLREPGPGGCDGRSRMQPCNRIPPFLWLKKTVRAVGSRCSATDSTARRRGDWVTLAPLWGSSRREFSHSFGRSAPCLDLLAGRTGQKGRSLRRFASASMASSSPASNVTFARTVRPASSISGMSTALSAAATSGWFSGSARTSAVVLAGGTATPSARRVP
jgi:hypothetical protein